MQPESGEKEPLAGQELDVRTAKAANGDMPKCVTLGASSDRDILDDFNLAEVFVG